MPSEAWAALRTMLTSEWPWILMVLFAFDLLGILVHLYLNPFLPRPWPRVRWGSPLWPPTAAVHLLGWMLVAYGLATGICQPRGLAPGFVLVAMGVVTLLAVRFAEWLGGDRIGDVELEERRSEGRLLLLPFVGVVAIALFIWLQRRIYREFERAGLPQAIATRLATEERREVEVRPPYLAQIQRTSYRDGSRRLVVLDYCVRWRTAGGWSAEHLVQVAVSAPEGAAWSLDQVQLRPDVVIWARWNCPW